MKNACMYNQSAFSLIEVLIALLILAVGMLSFAASEIMGQRGTHSALKRSHAITAANDLAERIHANPTGNYVRELNNTQCPIDHNTCSGTQGTADASSCTADQMATADLIEWFCGNASYRGGVASLLGGPAKEQPVSANVTCNDSITNDEIACSAGSTYNISLNWQEREPNKDLTSNKGTSGNAVTKTVDIVVVP